MRYIFFTLLLVNLAYFGYADFLARATAPEPRVRNSSSPGTDTIYLLSENGKDKDERDAQLDKVIDNPVRKGVSQTGTCTAVGPFDDVFSGQALVSQLQALDIKTELRAIDQATGENDFRVLIPPAASLQEAFRKLRELKSRNIDSYVITQGDYALGISLGVFGNEQAADKMQQARDREGYDVKVVEIPRLSREFWVFASDGKDLALDPELWASLVSQHPGLGRSAMPCARTESSQPVTPKAAASGAP